MRLFGSPLLVGRTSGEYRFRGFSWHSINDHLAVAEAHYVSNLSGQPIEFTVRTHLEAARSGTRPSQALVEHIQSVIFNQKQEQDVILRLGMGSREYRQHREDLSKSIYDLPLGRILLQVDHQEIGGLGASIFAMEAAEIELSGRLMTVVAPREFVKIGFLTSVSKIR